MVDLKDIEAAAKVIAGHVAVTPFLHSRTLSDITGAQVYLKFENHQFTASFKERGALYKLLSLDPVQARKDFVARQPMGRLGTVEDMVGVMIYLASDESLFATGQVFSIDGGMTI